MEKLKVILLIHFEKTKGSFTRNQYVINQYWEKAINIQEMIITMVQTFVSNNESLVLKVKDSRFQRL